jgi:multidrug transporter EmrE-like cation transporter
VHIAYFWALAGAYRWGELSFTYPVMRGGAPAIVAVAGVAAFGEVLPWAQTAAVALICAGILGFAAGRSGESGAQRKALAFALLNAVVIAAYTLIDARGVRLSQAPVAYAMWFFILNSVVQIAIGFAGRGREVPAYVVRNWARALLGGACTLGAYGIALFLGERLTRRRLAATVVVLAGLVALRL